MVNIWFPAFITLAMAHSSLLNLNLSTVQQCLQWGSRSQGWIAALGRSETVKGVSGQVCQYLTLIRSSKQLNDPALQLALQHARQ